MTRSTVRRCVIPYRDHRIFPLLYWILDYIFLTPERPCIHRNAMMCHNYSPLWYDDPRFNRNPPLPLSVLSGAARRGISLSVAPVWIAGGGAATIFNDCLMSAGLLDILLLARIAKGRAMQLRPDSARVRPSCRPSAPSALWNNHLRPLPHVGDSSACGLGLPALIQAGRLVSKSSAWFPPSENVARTFFPSFLVSM